MVDFLQNALEIRQQGNLDAAYQFLVAHARNAPTAEGWHALGQSLHELGRLQGAAAALMRADLDNYQALVNLGWYLHQVGRSEEAAVYLQKAVGIAGMNDATAWTDYSQCLLRIGRIEEALTAARNAVSISAEPAHRIALSMALMVRGEWDEAFKVYEARIPFKLAAFLSYPYPKWEGERVERLFVQSDMGMGDVLWALRFLPPVASAVGRVMLYTHSELVPLLKDWAIRFGNIEVFPASTELPDADAYTPMMSLPSILGVNDCGRWSSGYIASAHREGEARDIGIIWKSGPLSEEAKWRDLELTDFLPLIENPSINVHSLQYGEPAQDIGRLGLHAVVRDHESELRSMKDTARIIDDLDLVVCCDTAGAHLAGAMGKPVWMLRNAKAAAWIWPIEGATTAWYDSMTIFQRSRQESWLDVMERVSCRLK